MLVKFTEEDRKKQIDIKEEVKETINQIVKEPEQTENKIDAGNLVSEISRLRLSENDLKILEEVLLNPPPPNDRLIEAAKRYQEKTKKESELSDDEILKRAEEIRLKKIFERAEKIQESREEKYGPENIEDEISDNSTINEDIIETNDKEKQKELLIQMMKDDEELGLYDEPFDNPLIKEPSTSPQNASEMMLTTNADIIESIPPDDEISDWDPTLMDGLEDEEPFFSEEEIEKILQEEPTEEEIQGNFSTIEPILENIFHNEEVINETPISVEEKTLNLRQVVFEENTILETPQIEVNSNVDETQPQPTSLIKNIEVEKKKF
jgi:hypothetical protein